MKKYSTVLLLSIDFLEAFADKIPGPEPTAPSMLPSILVIGVVAVVLLLIVRRVRKRSD